MDQKLQRIQRANDVTCTPQASGQMADTVSGRHGRRLDSMMSLTLSIDVYLVEEQSCQISPLRLFLKSGCPNKNNTSSNLGSVLNSELMVLGN